MNAPYHNKQFHNESKVRLMTGKGYPLSPRRRPKTMIGSETPAFLSDAKEDDLTLTWFGHSSFLLQMGTKNILFDPVFSERSSPVSFAGPKRFSRLPVTVEELPEIDVLLLSHDHYDHLDRHTIREVSTKVRKIVVPLHLDQVLCKFGIEHDRICTLDWWECYETDGTVITLTPSRHFSGRNPFKRNNTLWGGYYMDNGNHKVYYTGDGGYHDVFKRIKEKLESPDLMISECGQYDPSWVDVHMFPEEVAQAAVDLETKWMVPVHWGTFCICNHAWDDSITRITEISKERNILIATPRIGQTVNYDHIDSFCESWWKEYD